MEKSIHEKISALRKEKGLTQEQLGASLGVSGQAVSKWENHESLPDILLLPALCRLLGVSADALLSVDTVSAGERIVRDFCDYALKTGCEKAVLDAISRLFNDSGSPLIGGGVDYGPEHLRVYASGGFGLVLAGEEALCGWTDLPAEALAYFLRPLADEGCLRVLQCARMDAAVTKEEIVEETGLSEEAVDRILLGFLKRNILCCDRDETGKRGYLPSGEMAAVYLIIAACRRTDAAGGDFRPGHLWFTRQKA